jgi:Protein of unknown function (DUF3151)
MPNLLPEPAATLLPDNPAAAAALNDALAAQVGGVPVGRVDGDQAADATAALQDVAARFPTYSAAWARLAERALGAGEPVLAYAYARTGYHRGLDQLRRSGWRGHGPVPWSHRPNQGFLRCLHALARAADAIGEADEAARCAQFLRDCDPSAADALTG